jgi:hypothetical protein
MEETHWKASYERKRGSGHKTSLIGATLLPGWKGYSRTADRRGKVLPLHSAGFPLSCFPFALVAWRHLLVRIIRMTARVHFMQLLSLILCTNWESERSSQTLLLPSFFLGREAAHHWTASDVKVQTKPNGAPLPLQIMLRKLPGCMPSKQCPALNHLANLI